MDRLGPWKITIFSVTHGPVKVLKFLKWPNVHFPPPKNFVSVLNLFYDFYTPYKVWYFAKKWHFFTTSPNKSLTVTVCIEGTQFLCRSHDSIWNSVYQTYILFLLYHERAAQETVSKFLGQKCHMVPWLL